MAEVQRLEPPRHIAIIMDGNGRFVQNDSRFVFLEHRSMEVVYSNRNGINE